MYQTLFKTNVNSDMGKMAIESFIDLLTSTDSDFKGLLLHSSIQLILHNIPRKTLDIHYTFVVLFVYVRVCMCLIVLYTFL